MPRLRLALTRKHHAMPVSTTRSLQQAPRRGWVLLTTLLPRLWLVLKQQQRAAFSASAGVAGAGSKDKHVDVEKDLEAVLEEKEAAGLFREHGTIG